MEWISVSDRLPEVEKRVLVSVTHHNEYNGKDYKLTTCAIYEDGTVNPEDSIWIMQDTDDEFMPAGWWEYHEYGDLEDDGVAFINGEVTHWMPLPAPPEVRHAKWVSSEQYNGNPECSACFYVTNEKTNYCPHCGCKMDKEDSHEKN